MSSELFASSIKAAIEQSNIWELRRIFKNIGNGKVERYLNNYWIKEDGSKKGQTFLHLSVTSDIDICRYLLSKGANPNQYDMFDNTPMHIAAQRNRGIIIRLLVKYGADPNIQNVNNKKCHQMCATQEKSENIESIIQQTLKEQKELETYNLPFKNPDNSELKDFIHSSNLNDQSIINHVLELILTKMNFNDKDNAKIINKWNDSFLSLGITVFEQLFLPSFENWPLLVIDVVPSFIIYCLEKVINGWSERLIDEIAKFKNNTKLIHILKIANIKLKNQYETKLADFEKIFNEQGIFTLAQLQNVTSRTYRILNIDMIFTDMLRKILNLYNINANNIEQSKDKLRTRVKKDCYQLIMQCDDNNNNNNVSCITCDNKYIHIAFMNGKIKAFDFEIFDAFHEFILFDDKNKQIHQPIYMEFLDSNHEQLVTADIFGHVCCWYLHSNHPNKRGKCIGNFKTHNGYISGFGISKGTENVYTIGFDGYLRVRNLGFNGKIINTFHYGNVAFLCMIFMDQKCVLIGTENGVILQIDIVKEKICNIYQMKQALPIRCLCLDSKNNHIYFGYGQYSIGLLDIENDNEWNLIGKFVQGFEHHQSAINHLALRNDYLWSCSEDNSVRIWELKFLKENLQNISSMPKCMKLGDDEIEVWCSIQLNGMYKNGVQKMYFMEDESMMIGVAYQSNLIAYDLERIDNILPQKQELISQRRQELNKFEQELGKVINK